MIQKIELIIFGVNFILLIQCLVLVLIDIIYQLKMNGIYLDLI